MKRLLPLLALPVLLSAPLAHAVPISDAFQWQDTPGVAVRPDPTHTYKALFNATAGAAKPTALLPSVLFAGTEVNVLTANGVGLDHISFVMDFHSPESVQGLLNNDEYHKRFGVDNPNLKMLAELKKAGVKILVCSQLLKAIKQPFDQLTPDATLASDGLVVLMTYQNDGYALIPF